MRINVRPLKSISTCAKDFIKGGKQAVKEAKAARQEVIDFYENCGKNGTYHHFPTDSDGWSITPKKKISLIKEFFEGGKKFLKEQIAAMRDAKLAAKKPAVQKPVEVRPTSPVEELEPIPSEPITPAKPKVKYERKEYTDETGLRIKEIPYGDRMVKQSYDPQNRLVHELEYDETGAVIYEQTRLFNPDGSKKLDKYVKRGVTQSENIYDEKGRLLKYYKLDAEDKKLTTTFEYDSAGNIIRKRMECVGEEYTCINNYELGSNGRVNAYTTLLNSKTGEEIPGMRIDISGGTTINPEP